MQMDKQSDKPSKGNIRQNWKCCQATNLQMKTLAKIRINNIFYMSYDTYFQV